MQQSAGCCFELVEAVKGDPENVLAAHVHLVRHVADRRSDRDFDLAGGVGQLHDFHAIHHGLRRAE